MLCDAEALYIVSFDTPVAVVPYIDGDKDYFDESLFMMSSMLTT